MVVRVTDSFEQALLMTLRPDVGSGSDGGAFGGATGLGSAQASVCRELDWAVPDYWQQGRGAWGGLVIGGSLRALNLVATDPERSIRTISSHIFGPVPAQDCVVTVSLIRRGSAMSTWSVNIVDGEGNRCAESVIITGGARAPDLPVADWGTVSMPQVPSWASVSSVAVEPPVGPVFGPHLEFRPIIGAPFSSSPAHAVGWLRFAEHVDADNGSWTAEQLLSVVDGWWPAAYVSLAAPRTMATVSFSAHLMVDPLTLPLGEPVLMESRVTAAHEGFTSETRRLWSVDGRVIVENLQSIVVVR